MKVSSKQRINRSTPYVKLIIVVGLISWIKDYQLAERILPSAWVKVKELTQQCSKKNSIVQNLDNPGLHLLQIFQAKC
jgi:hypothetical protein